MQTSIRSTLNSEHMAVKSVSCTPHTGQLAWTDPPAHLTCTVDFKDGTSYKTGATVQPVVDQPDALTWDGPPDNRGVIDITKAPLPVPTSTLAASNPQSLFYARNLSPVVSAIDARFKNQSVVQLALYPGELQAVIIDNSNDARLVTSTPSGKLKVGPALPVKGSRDAIYPNQVLPAAPQAIAALISARGGVPLARLARFELFFHGQNAYWDIYPISGRIRFEALLQGGSLKAITKKGSKAIQ